MEFNREYWENRYQESDTPWDTGSHHKQLPQIIKSFSLKGKRGYVPGCGFGYDAAFLAARGIETWASGVSMSALEKARSVAEQYSGAVSFIYGDMVEPGPQYKGSFDFIFEYTTFCSLPPEARPGFVKGMAELLKAGGLYITVLFPLTGENTPPPYPVSDTEFKSLMATHFKFHYFQRALDSIKPRMGRESLHVYQKAL